MSLKVNAKLVYRIFFLAAIFIFSCSRSFGQGTSNKGTDFWVAYAGHVDGTQSRLTLFITSEYTTNVRIKAPGLDQTITVPANQAVPFVIDPNIYPVYVGTQDGVEAGKGIHVTSEKPIIVYSHISHAARSAACLVYPTKALGNDYYAISYIQLADAPREIRSSQFTIVGVVDGTVIEVTPSEDSRGDATHKANVPFTISLNAGDIYQYQSVRDLSGSRIRTLNDCKPFSVFSGSSKNGFCEEGNLISPDNPVGQDNLYQQLLPVTAWGKNFVAAPYFNTMNGSTDIYRIQVSQDNTTIRVNGSATSANGTMLNNPYAKGSIITFTSQAANTINADKPVNVTQFQTSQTCNPKNVGYNNNNAPFPGDPEMTILNPIEQTLKDVTVYSAVSTSLAPTQITKHYINIVIKTADAPSLTVDGTSFSANADTAAFQVNKFVKINSEYSYLIADVTQSSASGPTHRIKADGGFVAIAYGYGPVESYGYLAGADLRNLNKYVQAEKPSSGELMNSGCVGSVFDVSVILPYITRSLQWDLGNGTSFTDTDPDAHYTVFTLNGDTFYKYRYTGPAISFSQAGIYTLKALVSDPAPILCSADETVELPFQIFELPSPVFTGPALVCKNEPVVFTDKSSGNGSAIKRWIWSFGDGTDPVTRLAGDTISHTFKSSGDFNVKLRVEGESGCFSAADYLLPVHVSKLPVAGFTVSKPVCENAVISFSDNSSTQEGTINKWTWDFGDTASVAANTSALRNPVHSFSKPGTYLVRLTVETDKGCQNTFSSSVVVSPYPIAGFSVPEVCITDAPAAFKSTSTNSDGTETGLSYLWDFGDPASGANNSATGHDVSHLFSREGEFTMKLTVTAASGCSSIIEKKFVVNGMSPLADFSMSAGSICSGTELVVEDKSSVSPGKVIRLEWYFDETDHPNNPAYQLVEIHPDQVADRKYKFSYPITRNTTPKQINIRLRAFSGTRCYADRIHTLWLKGSPELSLDPIRDICLGDEPYQLKTKEIYGFAGTLTFSGEGVSASGIFNPAAAGLGEHSITATFQTSDGCMVERSQMLTVNENPVVDAGADVTILKGGETQLSPKSTLNAIKYKWSPSEGLSNDSIANPVAFPLVDTKYTLTVSSKAGCTATDEIIVKVKDGPDIPNAFSPNADGVNDRWEIDYLETLMNASVDIYNRYGQVVYSSGRYTSPWDGTYKGKQVPVGVYYYIINPHNGDRKLTGSITLLR